MLKILLVFSVVFMICFSSVAGSLNPTFQRVKQIALTAQPDQNGNYFKQVNVGDKIYMCGYLPSKNCVGVIETDGLTYLIVEVVDGQYGVSIIQNGAMVMQDLCDEESATKWANVILEKFTSVI